MYDVTEQQSPETQRTGQRRKEAILIEIVLSKKSDTATDTDSYSNWLMLYECILALEGL